MNVSLNIIVEIVVSVDNSSKDYKYKLFFIYWGTVKLSRESKSYYVEHSIRDRIFISGIHYRPNNPSHDVLFFDTQAVVDPLRMSFSRCAKDEKKYTNLSSQSIMDIVLHGQRESEISFLPHALETTIQSHPFANFAEFMDALYHLKEEYKTGFKQVTVSLRPDEEENIEIYYKMLRNIDVYPKVQVTFDKYDDIFPLRRVLRAGLEMQQPGERLGVNVLHKHNEKRVRFILGLVGAYETSIRLFFDGPKHNSYVAGALKMYEDLGMHAVVAQHP